MAEKHLALLFVGGKVQSEILSLRCAQNDSVADLYIKLTH